MHFPFKFIAMLPISSIEKPISKHFTDVNSLLRLTFYHSVDELFTFLVRTRAKSEVIEPTGTLLPFQLVRGSLPIDHFVHQNPQTPHIIGTIVALARLHLRRSVSESAIESLPPHLAYHCSGEIGYLAETLT